MEPTMKYQYHNDLLYPVPPSSTFVRLSSFTETLIISLLPRAIVLAMCLNPRVRGLPVCLPHVTRLGRLAVLN